MTNKPCKKSASIRFAKAPSFFVSATVYMVNLESTNVCIRFLMLTERISASHSALGIMVYNLPFELFPFCLVVIWIALSIWKACS